MPPDQQQGIVLTGAPRPDRRIVGPGTKVTISLVPDAQARGAVSDYTFAVGDAADPLAPGRVILLERGDQPTFVNTSLRLLNGFEYLFDAENGIVGYRWTGRVPVGLSNGQSRRF